MRSVDKSTMPYSVDSGTETPRSSQAPNNSMSSDSSKQSSTRAPSSTCQPSSPGSSTHGPKQPPCLILNRISSTKANPSPRSSATCNPNSWNKEDNSKNKSTHKYSVQTRSSTKSQASTKSSPIQRSATQKPVDYAIDVTRSSPNSSTSMSTKPTQAGTTSIRDQHRSSKDHAIEGSRSNESPKAIPSPFAFNSPQIQPPSMSPAAQSVVSSHRAMAPSTQHSKSSTHSHPSSSSK